MAETKLNRDLSDWKHSQHNGKEKLGVSSAEANALEMNQELLYSNIDIKNDADAVEVGMGASFH